MFISHMRKIMSFKVNNRRRANSLSKRQRSSRNLFMEPLEDRRLLSLIPVTLPWNMVTYDSTGHLSYDPTSHAFNLDATPLLFKGASTGSTTPINADTGSGIKTVQIRINVDNSGNLIGGVAGPDLVITGSIKNIGSGTLLTGEISQFGYLDDGPDAYDFRFTPTGGLLQSYFAGQDIGLTTSSETSTFAGSFATSFTGTAKGNVGTMVPLLSSLSGNVYTDNNNDGIFEPGLGEIGIPNTTVKLTGTNVDGLALNLSTLTNASGAYSFTNLRPSVSGYTITETQPAGYLDGLDAVGTQGGTLGNDVISNIALPAGVSGVSNNFGELPMLPGIQLVKLTNGTHDPNVPVGDPVTWTYDVTNTGNVALSGIAVSDDQGVIPVYQSGDINSNGLLDGNEMWVYTASGVATAGQYANTGTAMGTATDTTGTVHVMVSTTDVDHYFGVSPGCNWSNIRMMHTIQISKPAIP